MLGGDATAGLRGGGHSEQTKARRRIRRKENSSKAFFMSRLPFAGSGLEAATHKATPGPVRRAAGAGPPSGAGGDVKRAGGTPALRKAEAAEEWGWSAGLDRAQHAAPLRDLGTATRLGGESGS